MTEQTPHKIVKTDFCVTLYPSYISKDELEMERRCRKLQSLIAKIAEEYDFFTHTNYEIKKQCVYCGLDPEFYLKGDKHNTVPYDTPSCCDRAIQEYVNMCELYRDF